MEIGGNEAKGEKENKDWNNEFPCLTGHRHLGFSTRSLWLSPRTLLSCLARIFHELPSRDREDGRATWQPQGVGSEAYLNRTSQEPIAEGAREDGHIRGRSR